MWEYQTKQQRTKELSVLVPKDMAGSSGTWKLWGMSYSFTSWPEDPCFDSKRMATRVLHATCHASFCCPTRRTEIPKRRNRGPWAVPLLEIYREWSFCRWKILHCKQHSLLVIQSTIPSQLMDSISLGLIAPVHLFWSFSPSLYDLFWFSWN